MDAGELLVDELLVDELHLDDTQRIRAFTLAERMSVGAPACHLVVRVDLQQPVDQAEYSAMDRSHLFGDARPGGLEYSRRVQEAGPQWLHARRWRSSVGVATATLFTKVFRVGMLTVAIAHVRRSRLPMPAGAPAGAPAEAAAPASDDEYVQSGSVSLFCGDRQVGIFDFVDFSEQETEVAVGPSGAHSVVRLMRVGSGPQKLQVEGFNRFYLETVHEDLRDLWYDALLQTNEELRQAEAAMQRRCAFVRAWQQVVGDACQAAARRKQRKFPAAARTD